MAKLVTTPRGTFVEFLVLPEGTEEKSPHFVKRDFEYSPGYERIKEGKNWLRVPPGINPETFLLYIQAHAPARAGVPRNVPAVLLVDLINIYPRYQDRIPFVRLGDYLRLPGDEYFWLYLAQHKTLFESQLNDHFYQEEIANIEDQEEKKLPADVKYDPNVFNTLKDLSTVNLSFLPMDKRNTLAPTKVMISDDATRRTWGKQYVQLNVPLLEGKAAGEGFIDPHVLPYIQGLLAIPGVAICGGYPASLIYTAYEPQRVYIEEEHKYRTRMMPIKANDVDIFIYGDVDIKETVDRIMAVPPIEYYRGYIRTHSISFRKVLGPIGDRIRLEVQIIKREYRTLAQILTGFDLDSSACAMIMDDKKNIRFYGTNRFVHAVRYGINVVNPFRQSTTFNSRLLKYTHRGFFPYIAGQMHLRFSSIYMNRIVRMDKGHGTLPELIRRRTEKVKYVREPSDYDIHNLEYLLERYEEGKEIKGVNREYLEDLFREFKESEEENLKTFMIEHKYPFVTEITPATMDYMYRGWLTRRPGAQATGSFHPTDYNYFGRDPEDVIMEEFAQRPGYAEETAKLIREYLP